MKNSYNNLMKYMRVKEEIKLEVLANKMFLSKSQWSLLENAKRKLSLDDFVNAMNYLGCEIKILKDGKDCMEMMKNELLKNGLNLTDVGYCKDYPNKNGELIRVEYETLNDRVVIAKDMLDKTKYLSTEKHDYYELNYNGDDGYGRFYQEYYDICDDNWEKIIDVDLDTLKITVLDKLYELFNEDVAKEIIETHESIISR